jgi:hypothetical protein
MYAECERVSPLDSLRKTRNVKTLPPPPVRETPITGH